MSAQIQLSNTENCFIEWLKDLLSAAKVNIPFDMFSFYPKTEMEEIWQQSNFKIVNVAGINIPSFGTLNECESVVIDILQSEGSKAEKTILAQSFNDKLQLLRDNLFDKWTSICKEIESNLDDIDAKIATNELTERPETYTQDRKDLKYLLKITNAEVNGKFPIGEYVFLFGKDSEVRGHKLVTETKEYQEYIKSSTSLIDEIFTLSKALNDGTWTKLSIIAYFLGNRCGVEFCQRKFIRFGLTGKLDEIEKFIAAEINKSEYVPTPDETKKEPSETVETV